MAKIKLYLDKRFKTDNDKYALKLSIYHKSTILIALDATITEEQWNGVEVINNPNRKNINDYLQTRLTKAQNIIYELKATGRLSLMSDVELRSHIMSEFGGLLSSKKKDSQLFIDHYNSYISNLTKKNTVTTFRNTLNKIEQFSDISKLRYEDMTISWMKDFDVFMMKGKLAVNSRGVYFRNLRALFNDAIDRDFISQNLYPFRRFKIPKEATAKRSLSIEELKILRDYKCEEYLDKYRDIFMLIFYLRGINIVDLANVTEITNGRIEYRRSKTGKLYSIEVLHEAIKIIDKYKGEIKLLSMFDSRVDYRTFAIRMNRELKKIGITTIGKKGAKTIISAFPSLSSYWARHTWATIAAGLDIPKETIAAALGHGGNTVTDIYISFDTKKVDEAKRKVLDAIK